MATNKIPRTTQLQLNSARSWGKRWKAATRAWFELAHAAHTLRAELERERDEARAERDRYKAVADKAYEASWTYHHGLSKQFPTAFEEVEAALAKAGYDTER